MVVRTRFAPSPTGYLHIGGARTALYSWLYARKHGGQFILRIEDTDRERSTDESVQAIFDGMQWLDLAHDEGPFYQTQCFDRYKEVVQQLLDQGDAYRCYCSRERLDTIREEQRAAGGKPRYDGHCRDSHAEHGENDPFVIRFKNPTDGAVVFDDLVRGPISVQNSELDDLIIARTDGTPTYNLTVVVDDVDMQLTHVIRGDDHINNTPRQINIYQALQAKLPAFAHLPMILGADGARLSKRHGAVSVMQYRDEGYLPQALLNYLVRLGWSHGDQETFSVAEMIELFSLESVNKAPSTYNVDKLLWLNQHWLKTLPPAEVAKHLQWHFAQLNIDTSSGPAVVDLIPVLAERSKTLIDLAESMRFFYTDVTEYNEKAARKNFNPEAANTLQAIADGLAALPAWEAEAIHNVVLNTAETLELKLGKVAQPIRVAVTGSTVSPSIDMTLLLLGADVTLQRLRNAIAYIQNMPS